MNNRIRRSMLLLVMSVLTLSYVFLTVVMYRQTLTIMRTELAQEAEYIRAAIEISGADYIEELDDASRDTRVTWIDAGGNVLYDSGDDQQQMGNHRKRKEFQEALQSGSGQDIRVSDTKGKEMFYFALRMNDGTVIRVAKDMDSVWKTAFRILPYILGIGMAMGIAAWILSGYQVRKLIRPINELDLENPLENEIYGELSPLLERIETQNKEKEKMEQMRREFSANVSHELKTPLTSISGYAEIMMNGMVKPEDVPVFSERIYNEASRMITLVGDIIKLSKLDEGSIELEKEDVDFYVLTREIVSRLSMQAEKRHIQVELVGEHMTCRGIRQILEEMIYNLCENAIKYNKENGKVSIWIGSTLQGKKVIVQDTGIGIPREHQGRIFERFYRVDKSHSRETGGTGLGLSIVKHGAILHHAEIHVESEEGKGTKIELIFHEEEVKKEIV